MQCRTCNLKMSIRLALVKGNSQRSLLRLISLIAGILDMRTADLRTCLILASFIAGGDGIAMAL